MEIHTKRMRKNKEGLSAEERDMSESGGRSGAARRDPWARFVVLQHHPEISRAAMFPGLGLGIAAFLVLSAVEEFYLKPTHHSSDDHHH